MNELLISRIDEYLREHFIDSILTNKEIARQGYISMSSYYEQVCEN